MKRHVLLLAVLASLSANYIHAAEQTAAELIEQARAQSREIEELKKVMENPDRNLRLAAFQAMMNSENPLYRSLAIEAGLASTDGLLRAQALKSVIFTLDAIMIRLEVDPEAPKEIKEAAEKRLVDHGPVMEISFEKKSPETDSIQARVSGYNGNSEVQGLNYVFSGGGGHRGTLSLVDDTKIQGPVMYRQLRYIGTAELR